MRPEVMDDDRLPPETRALSPRERADLLLSRRNRRDRHDSVIAQLIDALGGRDAVNATLAVLPHDDPSFALARRLADPENAHVPVGRLCRRARVAARDVLVAYNTARDLLTRATVAAIAARHVAPVTEDLFTRAAPHYVPCGDCHGDGHVFQKPGEPCAACRGTGQRHVFPDLARQKLALDVAKVTDAATTIHNDFRKQLAVSVTPSPDSFARLQHAVDRITRAPRRADAPGEPAVIDAAVVATPDTPA